MFSHEWKRILDEIISFSEESNIWFRGHASEKYTLDSGLFRTSVSDINELINMETQLFNYYKNLGYMLHGEENVWNQLYSMQHHGVKTRLLDWTESFSVALYFAVESWKSSDNATIWLLKPMQLNKLSRDTENVISPNKINYLDIYKEKDLRSFAIFPIKNSKRIMAQHGVFTIQGNSHLPLEKEFNGALAERNILKRIVLPPSVRTDAEQFLKLNGVNTFSMFPDLPGLSSYINKICMPY
ncbi:FRG domain-containing protein [Bacillus altitudinis]|uniref:FRG domain-containing protein n=1 Tax=Bacillus altitudinis TaxID=293387 RepID=UPI00397CBAD0